MLRKGEKWNQIESLINTREGRKRVEHKERTRATNRKCNNYGRY